MYKATLTKEYTKLVFTFKEFIDASCFTKTVLESGEGDVIVNITFEPEGKEGEE